MTDSPGSPEAVALVWTQEARPQFASVGHWSDPFSIYEDRITGQCVLTSGAPFFVGPIHTATLAEAKARAALIATPAQPEEPSDG